MAKKRGAHELQSMLQPFWPVQPTKKRALNLTKLQPLLHFTGQHYSEKHLWYYIAQCESSETYLVTSHAVLFHLFKLALQLSLSLHLLLGTADIHQLAVELFPVHLIHCLKQSHEQSQLCG